MAREELTIDNEQLTIMVSLRDEYQIISEGNTLIVNCQLSIVNCQFTHSALNKILSVST